MASGNPLKKPAPANPPKQGRNTDAQALDGGVAAPGNAAEAVRPGNVQNGLTSNQADTLTDPRLNGTPEQHPMANGRDRWDELLQSQDEVLDLVVTGTSLALALERIAQNAEQIVAPALCSIHLFDPEGKTLRPGAAPSLPAHFLRVIESDTANPCQSAAHQHETIAVTDLAGDARWPQYRQGALANGLHAVCAQPIKDRRGQVLGVLALHHKAPHQIDGGGQRIMKSMTSLAGFAIKYEKRERSRRSADERFASLAATIPGVVYQRLVTPDGDIRYTYISEGAKDLFGVSAEEVMADPQALFDCHGPEYRATFRERLLEASRKLEMWDVEAQIITRDGEEKWTHAIARPHRLPDGSVLWDGVILDNTWIKKAEFELRKAKEAAEVTNRAMQIC